MIWVDAHLSPAIAIWIADTFKIPALALRDIGLRDAEDPEIFEAAKAQGIVFIGSPSKARSHQSIANDCEGAINLSKPSLY